MGNSGATDSRRGAPCRRLRQATTNSDSAVLNGLLRVLRTDAAWAALPDRFPSGCICFRRFTRWVRSGVMRQILDSLARHLEKKPSGPLRTLYRRRIWGGKKRDPAQKRPQSKGTKLMVIADAHGLPLAVHTASANPYCVALVEATLDEIVMVGRSRRLVGTAPTIVIRSIKS